MTRAHLLQAIEEWDDRGSDAFLGVYGFTATPGETLTHEGRTYDSKAILGVAHRYAAGRVATMEEFKDPAVTANLLRKRGFDVTVPGRSPAPRTRTTTRTTTSRAPRASAAATARPARRVADDERPAAICPTCFTQLPATDICDNCA